MAPRTRKIYPPHTVQTEHTGHLREHASQKILRSDSYTTSNNSDVSESEILGENFVDPPIQKIIFLSDPSHFKIMYAPCGFERKRLKQRSVKIGNLPSISRHDVIHTDRSTKVSLVCSCALNFELELPTAHPRKATRQQASTLDTHTTKHRCPSTQAFHQLGVWFERYFTLPFLLQFMQPLNIYYVVW